METFEQALARINGMMVEPVDRPVAEKDGWHFGEHVMVIEDNGDVLEGEHGYLILEEVGAEEMSRSRYPYSEGAITMIGPQCFIGSNGLGQAVINYKGQNYVQQTDCESHDWRVNPAAPVLLSNPPRVEVVCANCGDRETRTSRGETLTSNDPRNWPRWES